MNVHVADEINALNCGITIDSTTLCNLSFADDIVLLARPNEQCLQKMFDAVTAWFVKWRLELNNEKLKVIYIRNKNSSQTELNFSCGLKDIEITDKYKYFGLWFHEHLDIYFTVKEIAKEDNRTLSSLQTKYFNHGVMTHKTFSRLYESLVQSILMYGSAIWGLSELSTINCESTCRFFLGESCNISN